MNTRTHVRRTALTLACGFGLVQAGLLGAGAMQPSTPETAPSSEQTPSKEHPPTAICEVTGSDLMQDAVSIDHDGSTITIVIHIEAGSSDAGAVSIAEPEDDAANSSDGDESATGGESESKPAEPSTSASHDSSDADDEYEQAVTVEAIACEAVDVTDGEPTGDGGEDSDSSSSEAPEAAAESDVAITPAEAIEIAQTVAEGKFESVVLSKKDGTLTYVVTIGDTQVVIDAETGEVYPPDQQP